MTNSVSYGSEVHLDQGATKSSGPIQVSVSRDLTADDNDETLECTASVTLTVPMNLPANFGCAVIPFGTTNIARSGSVLLNGASATLARAATGSNMFAIVARGAPNNYIVTG
jgi:hypothetical protein